MDYIYLILILIFFLAGIIPEITGFGVATVSMSLILFFLPPEIAIPLVAMVSVFATGIIAARIKTKGVFKKITPLILGAVIGVPLGMFFLNSVSQNILRIFISFFLISYAIYGLLVKKQAFLPRNKISGGITGVIAGFFSASFNIHGPLVGIYASPEALKNPDVYKDTVATYMFIAGLFTVFGHFINGRITLETLTLLIYAIPAMVCGLFVGNKLFNRLNGDMVKKIVYIFVLMAGIILLF
jgi:uncharacterized protein